MKFDLRKFSAFLLVAVVVMQGTGLMFSALAAPSSTFTITGGPYPGAPSYTIWKEGSNYFAKDENGYLAYEGINASQIIQNVVNIAPVGSTIKFSSGVYSYATTLLFNKRGLIIEGEGITYTAGTLLAEVQDAGTILNYTGSAWAINLTAWEVQIRDLAIVGGDYPSGIWAYGGVFVNNSARLSFTNVEFLYSGSEYYVYFNQGTERVLFTDCKFLGYNATSPEMFIFSSDAYAGHDDFTFINTEFNGGKTQVKMAQGNFWFFLNNYFAGFGEYGIWLNYVHAVTIQTSHFESEENAKAAIYLYWQNQSNVRIVNNKFHFVNKLSQGDIYVNVADNVEIEGNIFDYSDYKNINLLSGVDSASVWGNTFGFEDDGYNITNNSPNAQFFGPGFENSGSHAIGAGANTSCTFEHGLLNTPTFVSVSFSETGYASWKWSATSTQITITIETSVTMTVYWYAKFTPPP